MAFRDDATVLREKLEAADKEIATLRERNAALRSQQMPAVRWLSLVLGVVVILGAGIVWHLGITNRGLDGEVRAQQANVATLRAELDRTSEARAQAELASVASEAACRERAEGEIARARERVVTALATTAPTDPSPSRYFWIDSVRGRTDLAPRTPCLVTLSQEFGSGNRNRCTLEAACGADGSVPLLPPRTIDCTARTDGWANGEDDDGVLRVVMRGPQLGVRDVGDTWTVMLANERPCL